MSFIKKRMKKMSKKEAKDKYKDVEFEKNDTLAMFIAAFITFVPIVVLIVGALYLIFYLFLFH